MTSKSVGTQYETQASQYVQQQGLRLITKNFQCRFGEIDLIGIEHNTLAFIEVRYRKRSAYGTALESVHHHKQTKIKKAAHYFLLTHPHFNYAHARFDIVTIDDQVMHWLKGVFSFTELS